MPANLPPQYVKLEDEVRRATDPRQRLELLQELFRLLPKHKGTDKLQAELKKKISRARDDIDHAKAGGKKGGHGGVSYRVPHEGAGQVVLVGPPNAGKSALLAKLTNAHPEIAPYPFTTRTPIPGMMKYEDVRIQLVDLPPISQDVMEPWLPGILRSADAALFVLDAGDDDVAEQALAVLARLSAVKIELVGTLPHDEEDPEIQHIPTFLVAQKIDLPGAGDRRDVLAEWFGERFPILPTSAVTEEGLDSLRANAYDSLGVMRIYTKVPGKPAEKNDPFTLPVESTVIDLARLIHRDLEHTLKSARIWGAGVFDGQTVKRDHVLHDRDIVELHA